MKIAQRVFVKDPMHGDALRRLFEIDAIIFGAIAIKFFSVPLKQSKPAAVEILQVLGLNLKLSEKIELQCFWQGRHLRRAQLVENDLEH